MMMDSPEPSKNKGSSTSTSTLNATNTCSSSSESPQVQESPFFRFVNNLSPIKTVKAACHVAQGFLGLNSPPLVFTSPRVSCNRETQFLERPQCTQSPNVGKSRIEDRHDSKKSHSQLPLPGKFITDDIQNDASTEHCSPPPCVDEYLADPVDIDRMYSVNPDVKQLNDADESSRGDLTKSKEIILKSDSKDGPGDKAEEPLLLSEESNEVHQEKPANVDEPGKIEGEKTDGEWASQEHTKLESNLSADVSEKQHCNDSFAQCAGNELWDHRDCTPQSVPEPLQDVKECEDCDEMVPTSHVGAENMSQDGSEASLKHHGILRRCLQFEEAASNALGSKISPLHAHIPDDSMTSAPSVSKDLKASHMTLSATSSKMKMVKLSEPITSLFPQRCSGNFPATGSKPSGIGLHLNSIINAMPPGRAATTGMRLSDGLQGMKSASSINLHKVENMRRCLISSNMDGQSSVDTGNESHEIDASIAADSFVSESPSLTEPIALYPARVDDKRKPSPTDAGNSEDNQPSPSKKKKRTSITTDDNGCKRCNCKKSKCLKLYCDCFAAGIYCVDPCSCQGCLNRPEYEDTVLETRQQIESRNPLAFVPKIVQRTTDILSNNTEDVNLMTPSSARHKRGCNCKRSMCLKKYCECYQANVGCSSGCRCEGCKNAYGRKEDYVSMEHALSKERASSRVEKGSDSPFHNKLEMMASKTDLLQAELYDLHGLSPLTPAMQCSDQGKEAAKSRLVSGKYLPSPESDVTVFPSRAKYNKSLENSHSSLALLETNETLETATCDWQMDCNNVDIMDQSSPIYNSVANVLQLTPLSNPESMSSASSFSSKTKEWTHIPQSQHSHGCIRQLSGSSLRWRSSPITPMTRLGETQYLQSLESDSKLYDILEDETPDILKEASTPIKSVKATSPNQKRVSPPQSHLRGLGSSSSGGLRSGRKFILKAVPSFPPLTPCIDSKGNDNEDSGNSARE